MSKLRVILVLSIIMEFSAFYIEKLSAAPYDQLTGSGLTWNDARYEFQRLLILWDSLYHVQIMKRYNTMIKVYPADVPEEDISLDPAVAPQKDMKLDPAGVPQKDMKLDAAGVSEEDIHKNKLEMVTSHEWHEARSKFMELIQKWDKLYNIKLEKSYEKDIDLNPAGDVAEVQFVRVATNIISSFYEEVKDKLSAKYHITIPVKLAESNNTGKTSSSQKPNFFVEKFDPVEQKRKNNKNSSTVGLHNSNAQIPVSCQ